MGFVKIGKIKDAQGLRGHVFLIVFSKDLSVIDDLNKIYLAKKDISFLAVDSGTEPKQVQEFRQQLQSRDVDDGYFTFEVVESKVHKGGIICLLDSMSNRTEAEQLIGVDFYVDENLFESQQGETIFLKEILGFKLQDQNNNVRGEVVGFSSNGPQDLLVIRSAEGKEFLVPFVEDLIQEIDFDQELVLMIVPEGLDEI